MRFSGLKVAFLTYVFGVETNSGDTDWALHAATEYDYDKLQDMFQLANPLTVTN